MSLGTIVLNRRCIVGLGWRRLDAHPGRRLTIADLAEALGCSARWLRRMWRQSVGGESIREAISYTSLSYALRLIADGTKPEAAAMLAGFRSYWHFNRLCKQYAGHTASHWRAGAPLQISEREAAEALSALQVSAFRSFRQPLATRSGPEASAAEPLVVGGTVTDNPASVRPTLQVRSRNRSGTGSRDFGQFRSRAAS